MDALAIMVLAFAGYIIMYQLYGRYISRQTIAQDKVRAKLGAMIQIYGHRRDRFKSDAAQISLVLNNDQLSLAEALRIKNKLNDIGTNI